MLNTKTVFSPRAKKTSALFSACLCIQISQLIIPTQINVAQAQLTVEQRCRESMLFLVCVLLCC